MMTQALLLTILIIAALLILLGGQLARRWGLSSPTGISIALSVMTIGALLAPSHLREQLVAGDAGERTLVFAREIGLTGLFFLAGIRLKLDAPRAARTVSIAVASSGLMLLAAIALLLVNFAGVDWSPAIVVAASIAASSVWLPSQLSSEATSKQSTASAAACVATLVLAGALFLFVHLLGAFHEVGRARSSSAYAIVGAYELVKISLFFSFAWFIATRFLDRAAKAGARLSDTRAAIGYLLIAVLVFGLGRTALGELGALAWSFTAGVLFRRTEVGSRMASYRPAAAAVFLSVAFLPMFLQPHGRTVTGLPLLLVVISAVLIAKFAASALAARLSGYAARDARVTAISTLASGEMAVALLAFGLSRWVIEAPEYFAVLFFALFSMIASPMGWRAATIKQGDQLEGVNGDRSSRLEKAQRTRKSKHATHRKAGFAIAIAATALLSLQGTARAQNTSPPPHDDPVSRAIRAVEESVNQRAAAAEQLLAASKLVGESKAARQQGKRDVAREAVSKAESIAADTDRFNRSTLIDELLRLVAAEKAALDLHASRHVDQLPAGRSVAVGLPASVRARLEQYRQSFAQILEEEQVPVGLLAVALVESGFNPLALSPKGARGIWQFMPATAVRYGLTVQPGNDHRTHPEHSTRAAARYLRFLFNQFGDWKLALAAYNAGEQRVQRIIDRTGIRDFDEMSRRGLLPLETRNYVPAVLAASSRIAGTNSITKAKARQENRTRGGVVEALVKREGSPAPPEAEQRP